jgi:hypothetical protein
VNDKWTNLTSLDEEVLLGHISLQRHLSLSIEHCILQMMSASWGHISSPQQELKQTWNIAFAVMAWCTVEKSAKPMGWLPLKFISDVSNPKSQHNRLCSSLSLTSAGRSMKMVQTSSAATMSDAPGTGEAVGW